MRRFNVYAGVITLMVAASAVAAEPQQSRAFGRWGQVWGTWVWTTNNQIPALLTLHLDGTVSVSDGRMFGGLQPNSTTRLTPLHGVWERTGFQSIGGTSLYLIFDATTGLLTAWGRSRTSITFADDFDHFQGKMFVEGSGPVRQRSNHGRQNRAARPGWSAPRRATFPTQRVHFRIDFG